MLPGHGTSTSKVGGWRLAVGGWQRLAVGGWRRLVVGGWWLVGLAVGGWRLAVGGWWRFAMGGSRPLAVGGPWGLSLRAVLSKTNSGFLRTALPACADTNQHFTSARQGTGDLGGVSDAVRARCMRGAGTGVVP